MGEEKKKKGGKGEEKGEVKKKNSKTDKKKEAGQGGMSNEDIDDFLNKLMEENGKEDNEKTDKEGSSLT